FLEVEQDQSASKVFWVQKIEGALPAGASLLDTSALQQDQGVIRVGGSEVGIEGDDLAEGGERSSAVSLLAQRTTKVIRGRHVLSVQLRGLAKGGAGPQQIIPEAQRSPQAVVGRRIPWVQFNDLAEQRCRPCLVSHVVEDAAQFVVQGNVFWIQDDSSL